MVIQTTTIILLYFYFDFRNEITQKTKLFENLLREHYEMKTKKNNTKTHVLYFIPIATTRIA